MSLAQERFKSNLEFRYQIIVSSIELRKGKPDKCKIFAKDQKCIRSVHFNGQYVKDQLSRYMYNICKESKV